MTKPKPSEEHKPTGRPTDYNPEIAAELLSRLVSQSLRKVCAAEDMPDKSTFFRWLAKHPDFRDQYDAAARERAAAIFEETLEIADESAGDIQVDAEGRERVNWENVQRSKLRVDTRKWFLSKLMPRKYGDKIEAPPPDNAVLTAAQQIKRALDDIEATVPVETTAADVASTPDKPSE